jgi:hypothetical protein
MPKTSEKRSLVLGQDNAAQGKVVSLGGAKRVKKPKRQNQQSEDMAAAFADDVLCDSEVDVVSDSHAGAAWGDDWGADEAEDEEVEVAEGEAGQQHKPLAVVSAVVRSSGEFVVIFCFVCEGSSEVAQQCSQIDVRVSVCVCEYVCVYSSLCV